MKEARLLFLLAALVCFFAVPYSGKAQDGAVGILSPQGGEALQGLVAIVGTSAVQGFQSAEVSFAYESDPTGTWFLVQQSSQPVTEGPLAGWDTTTITDGTYRLRLVVYLQDGLVVENVIGGLRVRNYSLVETSTPSAARQPVVTAVRPTSTPLGEYQVTPAGATPLPTNPALLSVDHLRSSAFLGIAVVLSALAAAGVYLGLRLLFRR